jgi:ribose 5-phosphate isomerase
MNKERIDEKIIGFLETNKELSLMTYDKGAFIVNQNNQVIADVQISFFKTYEEFARTCAILCGLTTLAEIYLSVESFMETLKNDIK